MVIEYVIRARLSTAESNACDGYLHEKVFDRFPRAKFEMKTYAVQLCRARPKNVDRETDSKNASHHSPVHNVGDPFG